MITEFYVHWLIINANDTNDCERRNDMQRSFLIPLSMILLISLVFIQLALGGTLYSVHEFSISNDEVYTIDKTTAARMFLFGIISLQTNRARASYCARC